MKVSVQYAQEHFAEIVHAASSGEEVEIAQPGQPTLFLAPRPGKSPSRIPRREVWGAWEGKVKVPTDAEWKAMKKELEDEMLNGDLFPNEHVPDERP